MLYVASLQPPFWVELYPPYNFSLAWRTRAPLPIHQIFPQSLTINWPLNLSLCIHIFDSGLSPLPVCPAHQSLTCKSTLRWFLDTDHIWIFLIEKKVCSPASAQDFEPRILHYALWFETPSGVEVLSSGLIKTAVGYRIKGQRTLSYLTEEGRPKIKQAHFKQLTSSIPLDGQIP